MKKIKCSAFGGPCEEYISAATKEEMLSKGMDHVRAAHPEMVADIEKMTPEENAAWQANFDKTWDETPEEVEEAAPAEETPAM